LLFSFAGGTHLCSAQALVPNLGASGPQLAVLIEEVTRAGAPTGNMMMFPSTPAPLPANGVLPVSGVIGAYTVDLSVSLSTATTPSIVISGSPGTITKSGTAATRLQITVDGGLSAPRGPNSLGTLVLKGAASGECGINLSAAAGVPIGGGDIAWTPFPSGIYLTLYSGNPAIEEYRIAQPIAPAGVAALRIFLSADISAMGDSLSLPSSVEAGIDLGGPLIPDGPWTFSSFDLAADVDADLAGTPFLTELDPTKIAFSLSEALTFNSLFGTMDLAFPSRSCAYVVDSPDVFYGMEANGVCGLKWRGFGGVDTVVRNVADLAYLAGVSIDADQLFHHNTTGEIILTQATAGDPSINIATYGKHGVQTGGWNIRRLDGETFDGDFGVDFEEGKPVLRLTAGYAGDSVLRGQINRNGVGPKFGTWSDNVPDPEYFAANPGEDPQAYAALASDPRSPAAVGPGVLFDFETMTFKTDLRTGEIENAFKVPGIKTFWAFDSDDGGINLGGPIAGFGGPEKTVYVTKDGFVRNIDNATFLNLDMLPEGGLRNVVGNKLTYFDFTTGGNVAEADIAFAGGFATTHVFSTNGGGFSLHRGATHSLTSTAANNKINLTNDPRNSIHFEDQGSASYPVQTDTAIDISGAFTISDAMVEVTPWTPDENIVRLLSVAVDQAEFSGLQIDIHLHNVPTSVDNDLNLDITTSGGDRITLTWNSDPEKRYNIRATTNPAGVPPNLWPILPGGNDLDSSSTPLTIDNIDFENEPFRLFAVEEIDPP
jgi:hypothetical protein